MTYRLNEEAVDDMSQLYRYGVLNFGLVQADLYYDGMIEHFENLAENPYLSPSVNHIREAYRRSVYKRHSIYYLIDSDNVTHIMRVLGKQDLNDFSYQIRSY